jgi:hypothetical protein
MKGVRQGASSQPAKSMWLTKRSAMPVRLFQVRSTRYGTAAVDMGSTPGGADASSGCRTEWDDLGADQLSARSTLCPQIFGVLKRTRRVTPEEKVTLCGDHCAFVGVGRQADRCRAAALRTSSPASWCADPMCSLPGTRSPLSNGPCPVTPDQVFTVRTHGTAGRPAGSGISAQLRPSRSENPRVSATSLPRVHDHEPSRVF